MTREELDRRLAEAAGALPPEALDGADATPWRAPIRLICWGLALRTITFDFLLLQYLLPTVGTLLLYLGFRRLRREGRAFRAAWLISGFYLASGAVWLALTASPLAGALDLLALKLALAALQLVFLLCFRAGLRAAVRRAGCERRRDPLAWAVVWTCLTLAVAVLAPGLGLLAALPLVAGFVGVLVSLSRVPRELEDAGYALGNAPVRVGDRRLAAGYLGLCLAAVLVTGICANHLPLEAAPWSPPATDAARQALLDLGFPADILADLPDEHVALFADPVSVQAEVAEAVVDFGGHSYTEQTTDGGQTVLRHYSYDEARLLAEGLPYLRLRTVYVELPGGVVYMLHHFAWVNGGASWQDGIHIWASPDLRLELVGGALLYSRDGAAYTAPFPRLGVYYTGTGGVLEQMFGANEAQRVLGAFSFPFGSQAQRGWVLSRLEATEEGLLLGSGSQTYAHMRLPFRLPYASGEARALTATGSQNYTNFRLTQNAPA